MTTTPIAMISSPMHKLNSQSPKLSMASISISLVPRRLGCADAITLSSTNMPTDPYLPQYAPELFSFSDMSPTESPSFYKSAPWLKTIAIMSRSACKDQTMKHLLKVEARTLVERSAVEWRQYEEDPVSLSSTSTTDSLSMLNAPYSTHKKLDNKPSSISASALLLADRSRMLLNERESAGISGETIPDAFLGGIAKSTRSSVVFWMKKVVESMKWPVSVFFTAVHAMDYTLPSEIRGCRNGRAACKAETVIPLLSVACVLVGVSSECEHKHLSKTRCFVGQVPNVSSVKEIICKELSVVSRLNMGSLLHKTPVDFVLYFVSRLATFDSKISAVEGSYASVYKIMCNSQILVTSSGRHIGEISDRQTFFSSELLNSLVSATVDDTGAAPSAERILSAMLEVAMALSLTLFADSLHRIVPASRLLALVMLHIMSLFCPGLQDAGVCSDLSDLLFCLDYQEDLAPLWPCLFNVYELCLQSQEEKSARLCKCSSSSLLLLEILAEGRAQHSLPLVTRAHH